MISELITVCSSFFLSLRQVLARLLRHAPVPIRTAQGLLETFDQGHQPCRQKFSIIRIVVSVLAGLGVWLTADQSFAADSSFGEQFKRVLFLQDYNTRVVLLGTTLLGMSGGIVGVFMLLRKRSLVGDVVGHSALPGIAIAFILMEAYQPGSGKNVPILLLGAFIAGLTGAVCVMLIDRYSRVKSDAAMAIVLSLFYGGGTALLTVVQRVPNASAAGLKDFLSGKTASLVANDVWLFAGAAAVLILVATLLFKELCLLCFDEEFAAVLGWNVFWLDSLLTGLVVSVTILGMQSVGLLLVVAILVIPPASARFWTDDIRRMTWVAAILGGLAAAIGTIVSALFAKIAAGAVIVLTGSVFFVISLLWGAKRGLIWKWLEQFHLRRRVGERDLLRAIYEIIEDRLQKWQLSDQTLFSEPVTVEALLQMRSWSPQRVQQLLRRAVRNDLLTLNSKGEVRLGPDGAALARRAVRDHRLWEQYLITYAEIAPSHVDRDADQIEHVLGPEIIRDLEVRLQDIGHGTMPKSPHQIQVDHGDGRANEP